MDEGEGRGERDKVGDVARCVTVTLPRVTTTKTGKVRNPLLLSPSNKPC